MLIPPEWRNPEFQNPRILNIPGGDFARHPLNALAPHPQVRALATPLHRSVADILNAPQSNNAHEVRSIIGMVNYSSTYIRDFAKLTASLRDLTKKDVRLEWTQTHQTAFEKLKNTLAIAPCMSYFDKIKQIFLTVDASPVGISGILSQKPRNGDVDRIAYASRALTDTDERYSETEKEALAIVWSVEQFHLFLFGSEFTLMTDYKPIEIIYGQRTAKTSARIG